MGLHLPDLDALDFGFVLDMMTEAGNDNFDYKQIPTQSDFDRF